MSQIAREKLTALVDGTLPAGEAAQLHEMLKQDEDLRQEYEQMLTLREQMRAGLAPPEITDQEWEEVALKVVSRTSRGLGWTLFTPGMLALVLGGLTAFFLEPSIPLWQRVSVGAIVSGLTFLLMAAIADRMKAMRHERYDRVDR